MGFVVDKVALGQVPFPSTSAFPSVLSHECCVLVCIYSELTRNRRKSTCLVPSHVCEALSKIGEHKERNLILDG